jgi:hypothetical protein
MKLRGAFNPKVQMALGALMVLIFIAFLVSLKLDSGDPEILRWMRLDLCIMPISLLLGLAVGWVFGKLRFQALYKVLPKVDGQLFLSQRRVLSETPEGENAIKLQKLGFIYAFLIWFGLATFTGGRVVIYGSMAAYILGQFLTGQTVPFVRLFLELRCKSPTSPSN